MIYPLHEPYEQGLLEVGDGHRIFWEASGNPAGKPAVLLHGGPGSGAWPGGRRYFDPAAYRVVQFDQRNCGRSRPHASRPDVDLSTNTTPHLVEDIERLRRHLDVDRWLVYGGSWGCVLGLAYAQRHPERVTELVLTGIATGRPAEVELLTRGAGALFPAAWQRFNAVASTVEGPASEGPASEGPSSIVDAYHRLLFDPAPDVRERAARAWCDWEDAMAPAAPPSARYQQPEFRLAFARLVTHYWRADHFLDHDLIGRAGRLAGIPGVLVQGSLDLGNLLGTPWLLAQAWPGARLVLADDAGHDQSAPSIAEALVRALDGVRASSPRPPGPTGIVPVQ